MSKVLKIIVGLAALFALASLIVITYWKRELQIDLAGYMPKELQYCGETIGSGNKIYAELQQWLKENPNNWKNTLATYVPVDYFSSPTMLVNVRTSQVVVNYKNKSGKWFQVVRSKERGVLSFPACFEANNANQH